MGETQLLWPLTEWLRSSRSLSCRRRTWGTRTALEIRTLVVFWQHWHGEKILRSAPRPELTQPASSFNTVDARTQQSLTTRSEFLLKFARSICAFECAVRWLFCENFG